VEKLFIVVHPAPRPRPNLHAWPVGKAEIITPYPQVNRSTSGVCLRGVSFKSRSQTALCQIRSLKRKTFRCTTGRVNPRSLVFDLVARAEYALDVEKLSSPWICRVSVRLTFKSRFGDFNVSQLAFFSPVNHRAAAHFAFGRAVVYFLGVLGSPSPACRTPSRRPRRIQGPRRKRSPSSSDAGSAARP